MLKDKVALVTGAGSGIGKAISESLSSEGCFVIVSDISENRMSKVLDDVEKNSDGFSIVADVSDFEQVKELVSIVLEKVEKIDIVVNSAGIYDGDAGIRDTNEDLWNRILDINLKGTFNINKLITPHMLEHKKGRIINIASVGGLRGSADGISYTAAKFGVVGLTKRLAVEIGKDNVTVNAVCPGVIKTSIRETSGEILGSSSPDMNAGRGTSEDFLNNQVPLQRSGKASEVAELVTFLASEKSSYITGQAIAVDGGWTAT